MKIEISVIQSFAPSCLNRDDNNVPKSCMFGGRRRARVSSQCFKRTMRLFMRDVLSLPTGSRTRWLVRELATQLEAPGRDREEAELKARTALQAAGFSFEDKKSIRTNVALYLTDRETNLLAKAVAADWDAIIPPKEADKVEKAEDMAPARGKKVKAAAKSGDKQVMTPRVAEAVKSLGNRVAAVDIALFGRMVAENSAMEVDAACQVAHAISTHEVNVEQDFFTAADDRALGAEPGAGMMGIVEYNSACVYRYFVIDLEQLAQNLEGNRELARRAVVGFVRAALEAIPTGRMNSTAPQNPPDYVEVRTGAERPMSLVNAFERPVRAEDDSGSITERSIRALEDYRTRLERMYGPDELAQSQRSSTMNLENAVTVPELLKWLEGRLAEAS